MDRRRNPFVPGAGLQPPVLAGRDRLLENATIDMDRILAGRPVKGLILLGLRGVGKTVLLNQRHGETAFTVPMFDAFMKRQMPELIRHVPQRQSG